MATLKKFNTLCALRGYNHIHLWLNVLGHNFGAGEIQMAMNFEPVIITQIIHSIRIRDICFSTIPFLFNIHVSCLIVG
jgi:hypothetical protein